MISVRPEIYSKSDRRSTAIYSLILRTALTGLLFFSSLSLSYIYFVSDFFSYMGFTRDIDIFRIILSVSIIGLLGIMVRKKQDVASFFQHAAFLAYLCPALVLFSVGGASQSFFNAVVVGFVVLFVFSSMRMRFMVVARSTLRTVLIFCLSVSVLTALSIFLLGGGRTFNLDFLAVYEFRAVAADALPGIFSYIISPVSKVVMPVGIIVGIYARSRFVVVLFLLLGVVLFGLTHHKSIFGIPFVTLMLYLALNRYGIARGLGIMFSLISAAIIAETLYLELLAPDALGPISAFVVRRVFLVPPLLDSFYVDFFSANPYFYWASSRITFGLVETNYLASAPFIIGLQFFGNPEASANTGFIGSGFSNSGLLGVILYAFVIGLVISALNALGRLIGSVIVICASFPVIVTALTSSDLITVFLTHGLAALFVILAFMPRSQT
jgi:hypothetical protein